MQKITLKQLEMFMAVAECSSFTLAAERLYTTQSTVSMQIAALENALGTAVLRLLATVFRWDLPRAL